MKWKLSGSILVGAATTLALLYGCSSDDEGSNHSSDNTGGQGGLGGASTGGSSSTGGSHSGGAGTGGDNLGGGGAGTGGDNLGGGGAGTGGSTNPVVEICEDPELGMGGAGNERCAPFPPECGDPDDYDHALFGTEGEDALFSSGKEVIFGLEGDDDFDGYTSGACIVGGDGDDYLIFSSHGLSTADVGVGGPGTDTWRLVSYLVAPVRLVDVEADETINLSFGANEGSTGDEFVEFIENFGGTNAELTKATTRGVYDPTNGKIWYDSDGNASTSSPVHVGTVANADEVTLTLANFRNP